MKIARGQPEVGAMVSAFVGAVSFYLLRRIGPDTGFIEYRTLGLMLVVGVSVFYAVGFFIFAITHRRPLRACIVFFGLCWGGTLLEGDGMNDDSVWRERFIANRALMYSSVAQDRVTVEPGHSIPIQLSDGLRSLAKDGEVIIYRNEKGETWFLFVQYVAGVDNGFGYAWSAKGGAPPEMAYPQIVRTEPLGDGWYMFWST